MKKKWVLPFLVSLLSVLAAAASGAPEPARRTRPPNIVYFIIDELGYYELSHMRHPVMRTPNLDRFAATGMRFTQALAGAPVCGPSRAVLMTGKHMGHVSVRDNPGSTPIRAEEETLASMLKNVGYATGGFGKWGCGGRGTSGVPEKHGFDTFFGYYDQVHAHTFFPAYLVRNSREVPLPGNNGNHYAGETFSQYVIADEAKKFIRENRDRPFFAYLPWTPPHGRWGMPKSDPSYQLYKDRPWSSGPRAGEDQKIYAAMVNLVDRQVGEVLALLKELGLERDTLVLFTGDNGGMEYFKDAEHPAGFFGPNLNPRTGKRFRGAKGNLYEGGLRVPALARWPGKIRPGRVSDHPWYFPDVMPTLAEVAGAPCPPDTDGLSFLPELLGREQVGRKQKVHPYFYWETQRPGVPQPQVAVRMKHWKAIRPAPNAPWELYNLERDVEETANLADRHPKILAKMQALAQEAHTPVRPGEVYDQALLDKDQKAGRNQPPVR